MKPTIGRIVHLRLSAQCAQEINRRREDARRPESPIAASQPPDGAQVHVGNPVTEGDEFPMIVCRTWSETTVNGQVFLDGNDVLWTSSVVEGTEPGTWHWPERDWGTSRS
jgi:hypothetical protein